MKSNEDIRLLRQFQELRAGGGFVATYQFSLLQALADLSVGIFENLQDTWDRQNYWCSIRSHYSYNGSETWRRQCNACLHVMRKTALVA